MCVRKVSRMLCLPGRLPRSGSSPSDQGGTLITGCIWCFTVSALEQGLLGRRGRLSRGSGISGEVLEELQLL